MTDLVAIVLAAGEGTRMRSAMPKVLHRVGGLPMVSHAVAAAQAAGAGTVAVVIGPNHDAIRDAVRIAVPGAAVLEQSERLGTGHAVQQARVAFEQAGGNVVVLYADTPLVRAETIAAIATRLDAGADLVVVGFEPENPSGYGRLLTDGERLLAIREHRDATEAERAVRLCNSGIMGFKAATLRAVIDRIGNANAKGEYYLTDAVELANADGLAVAFTVVDAAEVIGVDDRQKLALAEGYFQERQRAAFMAAGVTLRDPATVYFSHDTVIGRDVTIGPSVVFAPGVTLGDGVTVEAFCHLADATLAAGSDIGPFARLRGGAVLEEGVHLGNFVEVKKSRIGKGTKAGHLSYLGDAEIGPGVNIGAGTITCNYDGVNKALTVIGAGAFIGSNTSLVAPVTIGAGAYTGSGSVITEDVEPGALALGRARQVNKPGYAAMIRERALALKKSKQR
ncbi:MAG: glmU [Devosia sp.]|nr:glmU [Devosia sp.]